MNSFLKSIYVFPFLPVIFLGMIQCSKKVEKRTYVEYVSPSEQEKKTLSSPHSMPNGSGLESFSNKAFKGSISNAAEISWETPRGWETKPASGMRLATFLVTPSDPSIECTIIQLGPQAGGLKQNLSRWARQLQLSLSDRQIDQIIEQKTAVSCRTEQAVSIYDFSNFVSNDNEISMITGIIETPDRTVFIKLTGPKKVLVSQKSAFANLGASLSLPAQSMAQLERGISKIGSPKIKSQKFGIEKIESPKSTPFLSTKKTPGQDPSLKNINVSVPNSAKGLLWEPSKGWTKGPDAPMRSGSYQIKIGKEIGDCSIVFLPGSAGGVSANLIRWARQIGLYVEKEKLNQFINKAGWVETQAGFKFRMFDFTQLKSDPSSETLLASIGSYKGQTVFVKLKGPYGLIKDQKIAFLRFCESFSKVGNS